MSVVQQYGVVGVVFSVWCCCGGMGDAKSLSNATVAPHNGHVHNEQKDDVGGARHVISQILRVDTGLTGAVATPPGTSAFARNFGPCPAWVPPVVGADKGHAAVLRLPDGRQRTRRHDHVRPVPWQPELSDYSGRSHTDPPDASSVKPSVPLDAADACCDVLRTNREHRQRSKYGGFFRWTRGHMCHQ
ncbi:hypothetical protein MRX96_055514 [Rhipicephalus microplus]